ELPVGPSRAVAENPAEVLEDLAHLAGCHVPSFTKAAVASTLTTTRGRRFDPRLSTAGAQSSRSAAASTLRDTRVSALARKEPPMNPAACRRRRLSGLAALLLLTLAASPPAEAACCYFSAKDQDVLQPAQKVFITYDPMKQTETFTVQPK